MFNNVEQLFINIKQIIMSIKSFMHYAAGCSNSEVEIKDSFWKDFRDVNLSTDTGKVSKRIQRFWRNDFIFYRDGEFEIVMQ